jgi:hypothetical protein
MLHETGDFACLVHHCIPVGIWQMFVQWTNSKGLNRVIWRLESPNNAIVSVKIGIFNINSQTWNKEKETVFQDQGEQRATKLGVT